MKGLFLAAVLAIGSIAALQGGNDQPAHSQDSQLEQGVNRVDGVLRNGLGEGTHEALAKQADSSAEWMRGFGESFVEEASK
jgi:hypothetical protein